MISHRPRGLPSQRGPLNTLDVLVVEDNAPTRALLVDMLDFAGYSAEATGDGAAALAIAERARPRLILLDLCMPVMDGWQFVSQYRGRDGQSAGPRAEVVLLSAHRDVIEATEQLGVYGFVRKPFDIDQLLATVARAIGPPLKRPRVAVTVPRQPSAALPAR